LFGGNGGGPGFGGGVGVGFGIGIDGFFNWDKSIKWKLYCFKALETFPQGLFRDSLDQVLIPLPGELLQTNVFPLFPLSFFPSFILCNV
jgi:hypothetical protein